MSEPTLPFTNSGWIEVIVGSMYSGKTEELIRRLRRAQIARQKVAIFKPALDDRFGRDHIVSHSELRIPSRAVKTAKDVLRFAHEAQVIGIDEGQFLGPDLVKVCERLARRGKRVIVAGLDQDYRGKPFEPMPQLLAIAEYITKTLAICVVCGNPANRSYRKKRAPAACWWAAPTSTRPAAAAASSWAGAPSPPTSHRHPEVPMRSRPFAARAAAFAALVLVAGCAPQD